MVNGRPGVAPHTAKREEFTRLIAEGLSIAGAVRQVGIHYRTGRRWLVRRAVSRGQPRPCLPLLGAPGGLQRGLRAKKRPQVACQLDRRVVVVSACCRRVLLLADFPEQHPQLANMLRADHHATLLNRRDRVAHTRRVPASLIINSAIAEHRGAACSVCGSGFWSGRGGQWPGLSRPSDQ